MKPISYQLARDRNGNRICRVMPANARSFSIQTNGNLPATHRNGICADTPNEVAEYVRKYGTYRQRDAIN